MNELSPRQHAFALAFVSGETMGQCEASAILAGYSPDGAGQQASKLLKNPGVRKLIDDVQAEAAAKAKVTLARVMAELGRIAFSDIRALVTWEPTTTERQFDDETGEPMVVERGNTLRLVASDEIHLSAAAAIAEVSEGQHGVKVKMHSKIAALIELGRHLGVATKIAHTEPTGNGPVETITRDMTAIEASDFYRRTLDEL